MPLAFQGHLHTCACNVSVCARAHIHTHLPLTLRDQFGGKGGVEEPVAVDETLSSRHSRGVQRTYKLTGVVTAYTKCGHICGTFS